MRLQADVTGSSVYRTAIVCAVLAAGASAQENALSPVTAPREPNVFLAATQDYLWVARVEPQKSGLATRLAVRGKFSEFVARKPLTGSVHMIAAYGDELFAVFSDEEDQPKFSLYRLSIDGSPADAETRLPDGAGPVAIAASRAGLYAIVDSPVAAEIRAPVRAEETGGDAPAFDPGDSPLSLVLYGGNRWKALAACPPQVTAQTSPAISADENGVLLAWIAADGSGIRTASLSSAAKAEWVVQPTLSVAAPTAFWLSKAGPTVSIAVAGDASKMHVFRRLGQAWSSDELKYPDEKSIRENETVRQAAAFNQHICLALRDSNGQQRLLFGRLDGTPSEEIVPMSQVFAPPALGPGVQFHTLMFFVLIGTFASLWIFRRGSMVATVALPGGMELAFVSQRFGAWLIDLIPFTIAFAAIWSVNWSTSLGELFKWAVEVDSSGSNVWRPRVLYWWASSVGSYLLYTTAMELVARRTIGKMIMRIHLIGEAGSRATVAQVLVRNVFRVLELTPPLWALNFLAVLTRNRQRLGDLFARTVVVRHAAGEKSADVSDDSTDDSRSIDS